MRRLCALACLLALLPLSSANRISAAPPARTMELWPEGKIPGQTRARGPESPVTDRRRPFTQVTNVSVPTLSVYLPEPAKRTGAAVLVCPGGGLQRLAIEHEGDEVAQWLAAQGLTAFVLKYRVPAAATIGLMDAQRAMGLIRAQAKDFQIDPERVNVIGFSAGGEIAVLLATQFEKRGYEAIDAADEQSCRPTNVALIYPGGLSRGATLRADIASGLKTAVTPPMFLCHAFADASENSLALATALKQQRIPCEVHLYQEGGHGFGVRESALPLNSWKSSYIDWLKADGFFDKPYIASFAKQVVLATEQMSPFPKLSEFEPTATMADAQAIQRRVVRERSAKDRIVGYTAPGTLNMGVLLQSQQLDPGSEAKRIAPSQSSFVQAGLAFVISSGVELSTHLTDDAQTKGAVESISPCFLYCRGFSTRMEDHVAVNLGLDGFLVGRQKLNPDAVDLNSLNVTIATSPNQSGRPANLSKEALNWQQLRGAINRILDRGYALRGGDLVVLESVTGFGAESTTFTGHFGPLGTLSLELEQP